MVVERLWNAIQIHWEDLQLEYAFRHYRVETKRGRIKPREVLGDRRRQS